MWAEIQFTPHRYRCINKEYKFEIFQISDQVMRLKFEKLRIIDEYSQLYIKKLISLKATKVSLVSDNDS